MNFDGLPEDQASGLRSFVRLLKSTSLGTDFPKPIQREIWKSYCINRKVLLGMSDQVPLDIWTFLWTIFAKTAIENPERLPRLRALAENMEHAGITLRDTQMLVYLEACYLSRDREKALARWRALTGSLGGEKSAVFKQFWELGTKMLAMNGNPEEALDSAIILFRGAPDANARIIIPIIAAWIMSKDDKRLEKAWALYQRLRSALSEDIEMADFDAITAIFLGADQPGLALGAFRDMMAMADQQVPRRSASTPILEDVFKKPNLDVTSKEMEDIDWSNFQVLARLPSGKRNAFFLGSWIKKLLGEKQVTAALQVLELMRKYRIRPYAIQLNGVVGALLRSKTVKGQAEGEKIAWEMIKARMEFLKSKDRVPLLQGPARPVFSAGKDNFLRAVGDLTLTPLATAETLALLIENYRRRNLHPYVQDLWALSNTLRIRPNTYILNQLLLSYYKAQDPWSAMKILHECVDEHHVVPDLETIKWLWEHLKQRKLLLKPPTQASARLLFAFTVKYLPSSNTTDEEDNALLKEIYNLVILCFGLVDDQVGTAIAMRTFQQDLGMHPQEETSRKIIAQLAASSTPYLRRPEVAVHPFRPPRSRRTEIKSVLNSVTMQRAEELQSQGIDLALIDEKAKGRESIDVLTELLKALFLSRVGELAETQDEKKAEKGKVMKWSAEELQQVIAKRYVKDAAKMMGVPHIRPWND